MTWFRDAVSKNEKRKTRKTPGSSVYDKTYEASSSRETRPKEDVSARAGDSSFFFKPSSPPSRLFYTDSTRSARDAPFRAFARSFRSEELHSELHVRAQGESEFAHVPEHPPRGDLRARARPSDD